MHSGAGVLLSVDNATGVSTRKIQWMTWFTILLRLFGSVVICCGMGLVASSGRIHILGIQQDTAMLLLGLVACVQLVEMGEHAVLDVVENADVLYLLHRVRGEIEGN